MASATSWVFVSNTDSVSSYLGIKVLAAMLLRLLLYCWWGLCCLEVSLRTVSDLILDLIHSKNFMIDLIPLFFNLYILQVFLAPSDTTINVMVANIMMMMMLRAYAVRKASSRWALAMMRLSVKIPNLIHGPPLSVEPHSFSSLLISDKIVCQSAR